VKKLQSSEKMRPI